jgi:cytochrome b
MIWSLPIRLLHWTLAICVVLNLLILEEGDSPHEWVGYVAAAAVFLRVIWGVRGSGHSQFSNFPMHPKKLFLFAKTFFTQKSDLFPGHNPAAVYVYMCVWICVVGLGVSGWLMGTDRFWGDETVEEIHASLSTALKVLIVFHLLGLAADSIKFRRHTWLAMIRGRK